MHKRRVGGGSAYRAGLTALIGLLLGCQAVYPELGTRIRDPKPREVLAPEAPGELYWVKFVRGEVPPETRDGRAWDTVGGVLPDPYAVLLVNDKPLLRTDSQPDTVAPTWPTSHHGNFKIPEGARLRVELWDDNELVDQPIGVRDIGRFTTEHRGELTFALDGGASVSFVVEPAHPKVGLGLWYELRTNACFITRTMENSPASREGLAKGDEVVQIGTRTAVNMTPGEIRSAFNAPPSTGLRLLLRKPDQSTYQVTLREGPIYGTQAKLGDQP